MTEKQKTQLRRKWKRWLKQIGTDLANLLTSNDVFKEIRRMVAKNKQIQSPALIHALALLQIRFFTQHSKLFCSVFSS